MVSKVINFVWFQTIWFLVILYQDTYLWLVILLLIAHFLVSEQRKTDILFGFAIVTYGSIVDGILNGAGVYSFSYTFYWVIPFWLVCLWLAFGLMLRVSLQYLQGKWWLSAILGAISGPLSYLAGNRLGAVDFPLSLSVTLAILALVWAITVPLWLYIDRQIKGVSLFSKQPKSKQETS